MFELPSRGLRSHQQLQSTPYPIYLPHLTVHDESQRHVISKSQSPTWKMDATPHGRRRRRRALAHADGEHSDGEIDELLQELGIPTSDSKKQGGRRAEAAETPPHKAPTEVIELLTPPPSPRGNGRSPSAASAGDGGRTPMGGGRRASIVDLTSTPSPASTGGIAGVRVATVVPSPADPRRRSATDIDSDETAAAVSQGLEGGSSDSDDAYDEIFATGLRRVARDPPPPVRSSNRPLDFSLPVTGATLSGIDDARTPPPKKRKRPRAFHSPAAPTSTAQLGSPASSTPVHPAPSPGRGNASKPTAASTSNNGSTTASISARLERSLDESEAGRGVRQALQTHVYNGKQLSVAFRPSFDCKYPRVIVLDLVAGASISQRSIGSSSTTSPTASCVCAVYFDAHAYLQLLLEEAYAGLTTRVEFLTRFVAEKWSSSVATCDQAANPQVFVVVEKMDHALVEYKKNARKSKRVASGTSQELTQPEGQFDSGELPDISFADLHEVAFQLFMDLGAHTKVRPAASVRRMLFMLLTHVCQSSHAIRKLARRTWP